MTRATISPLRRPDLDLGALLAESEQAELRGPSARRGMGQRRESLRSTWRTAVRGVARWTGGRRLRAQRRSVYREGGCGPRAAPLCPVSVPAARGRPGLDRGGDRGRPRPVRRAPSAYRESRGGPTVRSDRLSAVRRGGRLYPHHRAGLISQLRATAERERTTVGISRERCAWGRTAAPAPSRAALPGLRMLGLGDHDQLFLDPFQEQGFRCHHGVPPRTRSSRSNATYREPASCVPRPLRGEVPPSWPVIADRDAGDKICACGDLPRVRNEFT